MKLLLVAILSFLSMSVWAQSGQTIVGRWKVIIMSDSKIYMDFTKDSLAVAWKLETREDSALLKEIMPQMFSSMGTFLFVFNKDGSIESKTKFGDEKGTYTVNEKERQIITIFKRNGKEVKAVYLFTFEGSHLRIKETNEEDESTMVLERQH